MCSRVDYKIIKNTPQVLIYSILARKIFNYNINDKKNVFVNLHNNIFSGLPFPIAKLKMYTVINKSFLTEK